MTFARKAQTWDNAQLNNNLGHTGMVELSETDLNAVSGGFLGYAVKWYIDVCLKVIKGVTGGYGGGSKDHDEYEEYGGRKGSSHKKR